MSVVFEFCPTECVKSDKYDPQRFKFCDGCRAKDSREMFKAKAIEHLEYRFGYETKFDLDKLIRAFYEISNLEDAPKSKLSAKNGRILSVVVREKTRQRRLIEESKPQV